MNFKAIFSYKFLFEINRVSIEQVDRFFLIFGISLIALAIIFKLGEIFSPTPIDKNYRKKFFNIFLIIGLSELVWYGARVLWVRFFGSHFFAMLLGLIGFAWFLFVLIKMIQNYTIEKVLWEKEQVKLKYLSNVSK